MFSYCEAIPIFPCLSSVGSVDSPISNPRYDHSMNHSITCGSNTSISSPYVFSIRALSSGSGSSGSGSDGVSNWSRSVTTEPVHSKSVSARRASCGLNIGMPYSQGSMMLVSLQLIRTKQSICGDIAYMVSEVSEFSFIDLPNQQLIWFLILGTNDSFQHIDSCIACLSW